jgi:hypothetical protein
MDLCFSKQIQAAVKAKARKRLRPAKQTPEAPNPTPAELHMWPILGRFIEPVPCSWMDSLDLRISGNLLGVDLSANQTRVTFNIVT